jgi:serine/threonine-protein kinase HipA
MSVAQVNLWGKTIGAVSWDPQLQIAYFEYEKEFTKSSIQLAPFMMPLSEQIFSFPALNKATFSGLPGLLADSLPDKFGNTLIDSWLAREGRTIESFNPVDRLCYVGTRGMGALEFFPAKGPREKKSKKLDIDILVNLASEILTHRGNWKASFKDEDREEAMRDILRVGTSAGGARAKAIIAWNPETNEVRSGQVDAGQGFSYWLLKFDGVESNRDKELNDPKGYGLVEYAYYKMALDAGIEMKECRILEENNRHHFMAKRFDRTETGGKIHMQSLGALKHFDFNLAGAYSYEQAMQTIRELELPTESVEEQFRRMVFNVMGRNQDDHVKNIAFLMDKTGQWFLSPAYDITYSYNPDGAWTSSHQMTINGKRDGFNLDDFKECADSVSLNRSRALEIIEQVSKAISKWPEHASSVGVDDERIKLINKALRKF